MFVYVIFEGKVVKKGESFKFSNFSVIDVDNQRISHDEIKLCVENNFKEEHVFEIKVDKFSCTVISRKEEENEFYVDGFVFGSEKPRVDEALFELFDNVENAHIVIYGEGGNIIFANNSFLDIVGISLDEIRGKYLCDFILEPHKSICKHHVEHRLSGEKFSSKYFGVKIPAKDGNYRLFSVYGNSVVFKGKPAGLLVGLDETNETNLKRVYSALKNINQLIVRIENEYELLEGICNVIVDVGFKAAVVARIESNLSINITHKAGECGDFFESVRASVNGKSEHGGGIAAKAFLERKIILNPDTYTNPHIGYWRKDLLKCGFMSHCAIPIHKDGKIEYILIVFSGEKNAFVDEFLDLLTELTVDIEFALKRLEKDKYLKLIMNVLNRIEESVVITDSKCKMEFVNRAFTKTFGYEINEVFGKTPFYFLDGGRGSCEDSLIIKHALENGSVRFDTSIRSKSGEVRYFDVSIASIKRKDGEIKFVGLMRDITHGKTQSRKIEQLNRLYKTLFYLNEALISAENEPEIFESLCKLVVDFLGASVSFLVFRFGDKWKMSYSAFSDDKFKSFVTTLKDRLEKLPPNGAHLPFIRAFNTGNVKLVDDMKNDARIKGFVDYVKKYNLKKCFALPIRIKDKNIAVLVSVFSQDVVFDKEFLGLLNQITEDLSVSIKVIVDRRWNKLISLAMQKGFSYVIIMDKDFRVVYMNEAAVKMHGFTVEEIIGKKHSVFSSGLHDYAFVRRFMKAMRQGKTFSDVFSYRTKDGRLVYGYTTIIPFKEDGVEYYIAVGKDITKETNLQKRLAYLSNHDPQTGLPNKENFISQARDILKKVEYGKILAVAIVDVRNCSYINQAYGYKGGDEIIKITAQRITNFMGSYDLAGKLSGDKFALVLFGYSSDEDVLITLTNLLKALNKSVEINNDEFSPSYCIGVSFYPSDGSDIEELLTKAEFALANAKREGDNEIGFFKKKSQQKALKVIELKTKLNNAFNNKEFVLFYQPYYDIRTGRIAGAESLIRWKHNGKIISPGEFIDVLENSNLIYDVEEYLINQAVKTISECKNKVPISVNISAKSFRRDYLVTTIKQTLKEYGVDGRFLTVEIVERVFLENRNYTKSIMNQLKKMDVNIAVDDFGTGYSSLTYIRELPIDILKIDISFIRGMMENEKDLSLVRLIVNVAKEFGFKTVAEGVEVEKQLELLKSMECDYIQGFLFSKPLEREEFLSLLD